MELMQRYSWPGNVRELENCVERAVVLCRQPWVGVEDLPPAILQATAAGGAGGAGSAAGAGLPVGMPLAQAMQEPEKQIIQATLQAHNGNRQATAQALGINRTTLYKKMKRYELM
jgi:DNA-binding NtrC family response regulator